MRLYLQTDWYLIATAVCAVCVVLYFSVGTVRAVLQKRARIMFMEAVRILAVILAAFTLLKPELITQTVVKSEPEIAVLCDVSDSMRTKDVVVKNEDGKRHAVSREEWVKEQIERKFYSPLEKKFKVSVKSFAMPPAEGEADKGKKTDRNGTDISYALSDMLAGYRNLRAVILFSDGDWNSGSSPVGAAAALRARGVKVFTVPTGSSQWLPDLEVRKVNAPAFCLSNEKISIPFQIQSRMKGECRTTVTLESEYGIENSKEITIIPGELYQDSLLWQPKHDGRYNLTLGIPVQDGELITDNNSSSFSIQVKKELLKVLVVDTLPRWEYRYLRNALMRDPGVDVHTLLLHPGMEPGGGKGYLQKFPSKEELAKYDVIFLGDVGIGPDGITKEDAGLIKGLVRNQGSGLVFMPGWQGKESSLFTSVLGDLFPVELDTSKPEGYSSGIESKMELSGHGREHFLMMLADNAPMNSYVWRHLPGFFWNAAVKKERPGALVLAVHSGLKCESGRMPLIVIREYGSGNVLFMGTDSAWRWRKGVEDKYHYRFWGQVVRWMAHKRHLAHDEGIRCFFVPESPSVHSTVSFYVTVHDRSGVPVDKANVEITVSPASGKGAGETFRLRQEHTGWGLYKGRFTPDTAGKYEIKVSCAENGSSVSLTLDVAGVKTERTGRPIRGSVLAEIAKITDGVVFSTENVDNMVKTIQALPEQVSLEKRLRLWCEWWWIAGIIALLALYWTLRKLNGFI